MYKEDKGGIVRQSAASERQRLNPHRAMAATTAAYVMIAALFLTVSQGTPGSDLCREVGKVDPRGFYPRECYSILNDEGDCLFDRIIPQEECLAVYGEDRYRLLINFQNDLNACYNDPGCTKLPTID